MTLNRRTFFKSTAAVGAAAGLANVAGCALAPGPPSSATFPHGVASGDPRSTSVIVWTRLAGGASTAEVPLRWELSTGPGFEAIAASGVATAGPDADWTVSAEADGLEPATTYYYRWVHDGDSGATSPIGRTRTAPTGEVDHLRFAVVSCSNYAYGYFHNYRSVAERSDLDAVIHLGDYIYEYANEGSGETYGTFRNLDPAHEVITLGDYRRRYACYRSDPDLAEMHRQHPMIHIWDDHEFADDPYVGGAANHQPALDGPWVQRVAAALQAYGEWMPTRLDGNRIFRTLDYGDLVKLVMVDRQRRFLWPEPDDGDAYLGREQFDWLDGRLAESEAQWLVLVQQTTFGSTSADQVSGGWGKVQRDRVYSALEASTTDNLVVLTGDIHRAHALDLPKVPGVYSPVTGEGSVGVEFASGSISSPGGDGSDGGPQVRWRNGSSRTYLVLDITQDRVQGDVFGHGDLSKFFPWRPGEQHLAAFSSADGANRLVQQFTAATPKPAPDLAP